MSQTLLQQSPHGGISILLRQSYLVLKSEQCPNQARFAVRRRRSRRHGPPRRIPPHICGPNSVPLTSSFCPETSGRQRNSHFLSSLLLLLLPFFCDDGTTKVHRHSSLLLFFLSGCPFPPPPNFAFTETVGFSHTCLLDCRLLPPSFVTELEEREHALNSSSLSSFSHENNRRLI